MPAQKPISREYRIYLALWRRAYLTGEEFSITLPSLSSAVAMRQSMYRAIRPFRDGSLNDEQLLKAADKYVLYLVKGATAADKHFIQFRERKALKILEKAWDTLGIDEADLLVGEERGIDQQLQNLLNVQEEVDGERSTPFYKRD